MEKTKIIVQTNIEAPINLVWECWTQPAHIVNWNFASDDWCCPTAINELTPNGILNWRMEAKDGSMGFDFKGTYQKIETNELITYTIEDGRKVRIRFTDNDGAINLEEVFEAEDINSEELQRAGWQAILENFKKYVESNKL